MTTAIERHEGNGRDTAALVESVVIHGDLSKLTPAEKSSYYSAVCESIGVNPLTRPLEYLKLNGKDVLYARKDCTDQLRSKRRVSVTIEERETVADVYIVTARASMPDGRTDESTGAVNIKGLQGDNLANAMMKAETKAKRRVTLSICGLGFLDETELETIPARAMAPELPRISPHGELDDGVVYREPSAADAIVRAIQEAVDLADLKAVWGNAGMNTVDGYEAYHPDDRKRVSAAYKRRERQLSKPARELDTKAAEAATEGDL